MDIQKEREAFEEAMLLMTDGSFNTTKNHLTGQYTFGVNQTLWAVWQAAKAQAVPEWISIEDELPPTDTMVLICWSDSPDIEPEKDFMDICTDTGCPFWANYLNDMPTHWMHLPVVAQESK